MIWIGLLMWVAVIVGICVVNHRCRLRRPVDYWPAS